MQKRTEIVHCAYIRFKERCKEYVHGVVKFKVCSEFLSAFCCSIDVLPKKESKTSHTVSEQVVQ